MVAAWSADALWTKAKVFVGRASHATEAEEQLLWYSLALELLARAALSSVHPALLAEVSTNEPEQLLHAFGGALPKKGLRSVTLAQVLLRLRALRPEFTEDHANLCAVFAAARNEELHGGGLGFEVLKAGSWLVDFFRAAAPLLTILNRKPVTLYGKEGAKMARKLLAEGDKALVASVKRTVAGRSSLFEAKAKNEQEDLRKLAKERSDAATATGHRVACPACSATAIVMGVVAFTHDPLLDSGTIIVRQKVLPTKLRCFACGLRLTSTAALRVVGLASPFTRESHYSPLDFYADEFEAQEEEGWGDYNNE